MHVATSCNAIARHREYQIEMDNVLNLQDSLDHVLCMLDTCFPQTSQNNWSNLDFKFCETRAQSWESRDKNSGSLSFT